MLTPVKNPLYRKKISKEDRTHDPASSRTTNPTHYQVSYSGPKNNNDSSNSSDENGPEISMCTLHAIQCTVIKP